MRHKVAENDFKVVYSLERVEYGEPVPAGFIGAIKEKVGNEVHLREEAEAGWPTLDEALAWMNTSD